MPRALTLALLLAAAASGSTAAAQAMPTLHVAVAGRVDRLGVPAIEWLCGTHLPGRPEWPAGLDPSLPIQLTVSARGVRIERSDVRLQKDVAAIGSCSFAGERPMVWSCGTNGTEDWFVPRDWPVPAAWTRLVRGLEADLLEEPRSLDCAVIVGHLAGGLLDGDPRGDLLRLGAALCGEVHWLAWSTPTHLRVRGRSDGGLTLPAALLAIAAAGNERTTATLPLRAYAARDGDRAEAARQLVRATDTAGEAPLAALLHAEDAVALAAIDALVRLRRADALPEIVKAARPEAPWAALAAADAVRALWAHCSPAERQRTRAAIGKSQSLAVRQIDLDSLPTRAGVGAPAQPDPAAAARLRALFALGVLAIGLSGLWARERARLRPTGS